ncbi:hypothetical protein [Streptomyces sp. NPDC003077]|uniref:hypothetical protein n=1 Tax=Streptomyces sp. NPDC003077 TaxID=3154443 RepID=UPI0033AD925E
MSTVSSSLPFADQSSSFAQEITALVTATAPRLFAVVEEFTDAYGERDAYVAAWGLADRDDHGPADDAGRPGGHVAVLRRARDADVLRPGGGRPSPPGVGRDR